MPSFRLAARGSGVPYDYFVTNDGDVNTAGSLLYVLALGAATLSGKRIKVAPGMYSNQTLEFDAVPSSPVTIIAADPNDRPKFNIMRYGRSAAGKPFSNVILENIDCVTNDWSLATKPAVALDNVDNVTWRNCKFYGGYRGDLSVPFDVTKDDYPELAAIYPQFNDSGVITSLVINNYPNCYVGDLKADGTYPLVFSNTANITFTSPPSANFTVSGGYITATSDLVGGTAVTTGTSNPIVGSDLNEAWGVLSQPISWDGQERFVSYSQYGIQAYEGPSLMGTLVLDECTLTDLNSAIKPGDMTSGSVTCTSCVFDRIYTDMISFGAISVANAPPAPVYLYWNSFNRPMAKPKDPGDPHSDVAQAFSNSTANREWEWVFEGNTFLEGETRGEAQGFFLNHIGSTGLAKYKVRAVGNIILTSGTTGMKFATFADGSYVARNTVLYYDVTDPDVGSGPLIIVTADYMNGQSAIIDNILGQFSITAGANTTPVRRDNNLAVTASEVAYDLVVTDPVGRPTTLAEALADFQPIGDGVGKGAIGDTDYINHLTKTIDRTYERPYIYWTPEFDVATSSSVPTPWALILGGPDTIPITGVTGCQWQVADDSDGNGATTPSSSDGSTAPEKWMRLIIPTSALGVTTSTGTVELNGFSYSAEVTTLSLLNFTPIDNQATAYSSSSAPSPNETGIRRALIAWRCRPDVITSTMNLFSNSTASPFRVSTTTGNKYRGQFISSARLNQVCDTTPAVAGRWDTHIWGINIDATTRETVSDWWINGVQQVASSGSDIDITGAGASTSTNTLFSGGIGLFGEADGGGTRFDGALEFFWMHWGDSNFEIPDLSDSAVRNKFTRELIDITDGSGPLGFPPKLFWPGDDNLTDWNDGTTGVANRGSLTLPMIRRAGTYT